MSDPTKKEIPINPKSVPDPKTLWYTMQWQCSVAAGFSIGPDEKILMANNDDKHPSEKKRMEDAAKK